MNILTPTRGTATILGVDSRAIGPQVLQTSATFRRIRNYPAGCGYANALTTCDRTIRAGIKSSRANCASNCDCPKRRRIIHLSHGMRLKMALACALAFRPQLLVLDEPFSGLDALVRDEVAAGFLQQAAGLTVLISSHELAR